MAWDEQIDRAEPDLVRHLLKTVVRALMGAEADATCGAPFGTRSDERGNSRNGYRPREWDTRVGTIAAAMLILARDKRATTADLRVLKAALRRALDTV